MDKYKNLLLSTSFIHRQFSQVLSCWLTDTKLSQKKYRVNFKRLWTHIWTSPGCFTLCCLPLWTGYWNGIQDPQQRRQRFWCPCWSDSGRKCACSRHCPLLRVYSTLWSTMQRAIGWHSWMVVTTRC